MNRLQQMIQKASFATEVDKSEAIRLAGAIGKGPLPDGAVAWLDMGKGEASLHFNKSTDSNRASKKRAMELFEMVTPGYHALFLGPQAARESDAEQPAGAVGVQAWMANDGTGRVIDAKAKAAADRSGGATASAMAAYTIPLTPPAASVDDAMIERALVNRAFREDGAQWPDAYSDEEQQLERDNMRRTLAAALRTKGPSAYCRACQSAGMSNCAHFDECSGATCITCHRPLNAMLDSAGGAKGDSRERVLEMFLGRIFAAQRVGDDGEYKGWKIAGRGSLNEVVDEARDYLNCPLTNTPQPDGGDGAVEPYAYVSGIDGSYNDARNSTTFRWYMEAHRAGKPRWPEGATLLYTRPSAAAAVPGSMALYSTGGVNNIHDYLIDGTVKAAHYEYAAGWNDYRKAMLAAAPAAPAASVDVEGLRALADEMRGAERPRDYVQSAWVKDWANRIRKLIDSAGGAKGDVE